MATLEERIALSKRRGSEVAIQSNPLEDNGPSLSNAGVKVQNLTNARLILIDELSHLIKKLEEASENQEIIDILDVEKEPYLFQSADLMKLVLVTPSVKTRLAIISLIGPRVTDPRSSVNKFLDLFRYSEEKHHVEEIFKARIQAMNSSHFKSSESQGGGLTRPRSGRGFATTGRGAVSKRFDNPLPTIESRHNSLDQEAVTILASQLTTAQLTTAEDPNLTTAKSTATTTTTTTTTDNNESVVTTELDTKVPFPPTPPPRPANLSGKTTPTPPDAVKETEVETASTEEETNTSTTEIEASVSTIPERATEEKPEETESNTIGTDNPPEQPLKVSSATEETTALVAAVAEEETSSDS